MTAKPASKDKTIFDVIRNKDFDYHHITIRVMTMDEWDWQRAAINFTWQSDRKDFDKFYGFHMEIDADGSDKFNRAAELGKKIMHGQERTLTPGQLIARLQALKIQLAVYDKRISKLVPVCELAPADMHPYHTEEPAA